MRIAIIGTGAIASYVERSLAATPHTIKAVLVRPERVQEAPGRFVGSISALPDELEAVVDCAGHGALRDHGPAILERGLDLVSVSVGALADAALSAKLEAAAMRGNTRLHLASGAIGALDCLQSARVGTLDKVTYVGRKPPCGWKGSPAESVTNLDAMQSGAVTHFVGSARDAALRYPRNANVAAAVALAGVGFDSTEVRLIADADIRENVHEIRARGDFGAFQFRVCGKSLPDNPRSSALAAMSVIAKLDQISRRIMP
ncbi:MAG: aspartate dehydrogenase [Boseongicola sp.]|nr:aspartate dehydrogenase [Boseongicola sp.]